MASNTNLTLTLPTDSQMLKEIWQKMPILDTLLIKVQAISSRVDAMEERVKLVETHNMDLDTGFSYMGTQLDDNLQQ